MKDKIKRIMAEVFKEDLKNISDEISQANYDKWDSLLQLSLIVELEREFDISFEPAEMGRMVDFNTVCSIIEEKIK